MKGIILAESGFEDLELFYPYHRLKEEGIEMKIVSSQKEITGKRGYTIKVDLKYRDVNEKICRVDK